MRRPRAGTPSRFRVDDPTHARSDRLGHRHPDLLRRLLDRARLGYRHQPAVLFRGSWKLQPVLGIANATAGQPFAIRNRNTDGDYVRQGKRFRFGVTLVADVVRLLPRHRPAQPDPAQLLAGDHYNYSSRRRTCRRSSPAAMPSRGSRSQLRSDAARRISRVALADLRGQAPARAPATPLDARARKIRLLSINTSPHQLRLRAGQEAGPDRLGHRGAHQLVPERPAARLQPSLTHDLWRGRRGHRHRRLRPVPRRA